MQQMKQSSTLVETAYLLRQNKSNFNNIVGIDINKKYTIRCSGVKKTSASKINTPHKLEAQFNQLATVIDKKPNGFIKRIKASK
jgi:hypothetical protein